MDSKERRKIGGNKRRQSRSCGKPAYPQDFVKRLFTEPIILKKNRKNALGLPWKYLAPRRKQVTRAKRR